MSGAVKKNLIPADPDEHGGAVRLHSIFPLSADRLSFRALHYSASSTVQPRNCRHWFMARRMSACDTAVPPIAPKAAADDREPKRMFARRQPDAGAGQRSGT